MSFQHATQLSDDTHDQRLQSTFALDLLTQVASNLPATEFNKKMAYIFGGDITERTYSLLRDRLLAGQIANPSVVITEHSPYYADYDNRERTIRIDSVVVQHARDNPDAVQLLELLLHEFGHHIDNLLRQDLSDDNGGDYAPLSADASGEEGARFAGWMAHLGKFETSKVKIATWQHLEWNQAFDLYVRWDIAAKEILEHHNADFGRPGQPHIHPDREAFEAGDGDSKKRHHTHKTIESTLAILGFSAEELDAVYFGNWLRDYSQLLDPKIVRAVGMPKDFPDVLSRDALTRIVDVLSVKRFSAMRQKAPEHYRVTPEKLGVYRPSEHIDNPKTNARNAPDPRQRDADFEALVMPGDPLLEIDYDTSMKRYIQRSVEFMTSELRIAMQEKRTPAGLRALGSALHVLEDFFAHSNFVELSLIKNGYPAVVPWTSSAHCKAGLPLVTGMFGPSDVVASLAGPLAEILFGIDDAIYMPIKPGDRSEREQILLILLEEHHNPRYLQYFQGFLEARDGWVDLPFAEFLQRCANYLRGAHAVVGNAIGIIQHDMFKMLGSRVDDWQTRYGEDPGKNGSTDPTHSQLAKDHAEHPLHELASALATSAVYNVGQAMRAYWNGDVQADPVAVAAAYFQHPENLDWQDMTILVWAEAYPQMIQRSESKTELASISQNLSKSGSRALEQMRRDSVSYLDFLRGEFVDKDSPFWKIYNLTPMGFTLREVLIRLGALK
jgi:hypothetical protein